MANLKLATAMAKVDEDFSAESAEAEAEMEQAAKDVEAALETIQTEHAPSRIKRAREWTDRLLAELEPQEKELQIKLATADAEFDVTVAEAQVKRDRIKAEISADLKQATALRAATTVYQGELRKAEL